jgi:uncharacterized membrane protein
VYAHLLQLFGFGLCHQLPERSFFGGGVQVPVCIRDTGIYVGFIISLLLIQYLQRRPASLPSVWTGLLLGFFVLVMAIDGVTSYAALRETTNAVRLVTGLLAGYAMGALSAPLINDQLWRSSSPERVLGRPRVLAWWLGSLPVAFVVLWLGGDIFGVVYPLLVVLAILATLTSVNLIIVTMPRAFERRADRLRDAWLPLLIAFGLSWAEIAASAGMKILLERLLT